MRAQRPDELLAAMARLATRHEGKRGRPPVDSIADLNTGMRRFAFEVFSAERALGGRRGDLTKATIDVAQRYGLNDQTLRKAVQRHRDLRKIAHFERRQTEDWAELSHRMRDFPPIVRQWLDPLPAAKVLTILRAESIDGDCPDVLIKAARAALMSPS